MKATVRRARGTPVAKRIDTGVVVVTGENVDAPEAAALLGSHPASE